MTVKRRLKKVFDEILAEVESNASFAERILLALDKQATNSKQATDSEKKRRRRTAAVLDPISILELEGEDSLRSSLVELDIEQLKDIVAEYGMDQAKLVMKWNATERIIDHIVSTAISRSKKGDAFR
jgi:hypothetical protein